MVQIFVGACDGVCRDYLAVGQCGSRACFDCRFDGSDIATYHNGYVCCPDLFFADEFDVGGFEHGIAGDQASGESLSFENAECV